MLPHRTVAARQPVAVVGAGDLVSHLFRGDDWQNSENYHFSLVRLCEGRAATHELRPCELKNMIKLCQVMAFAIADDGWLPTQLRQELFDLSHDLDAITQRWDEVKNG